MLMSLKFSLKNNWFVVIKKVIFVLLCLLIPHDGVGLDVKGRDPGFIRIAILKDVKNVGVAIRGPYKIIDPVTQKVFLEGRTLRRVMMAAVDKGIQLQQNILPVKRLRFLPKRDIMVPVKGKLRKFRGAVDVVVTSENQLTLVNVVDVERYIKGVLFHEVSDRWPMEAMKAQAVAARSYAFYQMAVNKDQVYDVTSDIYSQVYGGKSAERYRTNIAVNRTKGKVLIFAEEILPAYYHSNCGGHTEDVTQLWKHDLAPLKGVACKFCQKAPNYRWKKNYQLKVMQEALNAGGHPIGLIKTIEVVSRNASGRIETLRVTGRDGITLDISGKDFRHLIGPNILKSNAYEIVMKGYFVDLIGQGWGHGVGMCQWGAHQMSKERHDYQEILAYYYPGARIGPAVSLSEAQ